MIIYNFCLFLNKVTKCLFRYKLQWYPIISYTIFFILRYYGTPSCQSPGYFFLYRYQKCHHSCTQSINSYSKLPAGRTISGVFFKNRHFSPIASVFLCGVFVLYCISLKLSESTVFNHVFLILF